MITQRNYPLLLVTMSVWVSDLRILFKCRVQYDKESSDMEGQHKNFLGIQNGSFLFAVNSKARIFETFIITLQNETYRDELRNNKSEQFSELSKRLNNVVWISSFFPWTVYLSVNPENRNTRTRPVVALTDKTVTLHFNDRAIQH